MPVQFQSVLERHRPATAAYEALYKDLHQNPELSMLETETANKIAAHLEKLSPDFEVRRGIGKTGVIGILRNGDGPTLLLRADMDALPVREKTGLAYASTKTMLDTNMDNVEKPAMHACGHDFHVTCNLAAAETLLRARDEWSGTVVFLFQPGEERGIGAQAMVDDGLYDPKKHACPVPDVLLGQHVYPMRGGLVATKAGSILSSCDNWRITIHGKGGHGSMPHCCIDPTVIASHIVIKLQTIKSRELPPDEAGVITVGSLKVGDTVNVIPDEAVLQVNMRSTSSKWRKVMNDSLKRIVRAESDSGRSPKPPQFEYLNGYPLTENDDGVTKQVQESFKAHFGSNYSTLEQPAPASEDFQILADAVGKPSCYWTWGGVDPEEWDRREKEGTLDDIAVNHSAYFAPAIEPTISIGIDAMVVGALTFLGKKSSAQS